MSSRTKTSYEVRSQFILVCFVAYQSRARVKILAYLGSIDIKKQY